MCDPNSEVNFSTVDRIEENYIVNDLCSRSRSFTVCYKKKREELKQKKRRERTPKDREEKKKKRTKMRAIERDQLVQLTDIRNSV